jgi:hypothetical protein
MVMTWIYSGGMTTLSGGNLRSAMKPVASDHAKGRYGR